MVLPRFERLKEGLTAARDLYRIVVFSSVSIFLGIEIAALLSPAGAGVPLAVIIPMLIGFFFIVLGSLMPHIRRNTTIGVRLPWTVRDETVWKKTHEHGGPVFVLAGVLVVLASPFAGIGALSLMLGIILAASLYITGGSCRLAKAVAAGEGEQ